MTAVFGAAVSSESLFGKRRGNAQNPFVAAFTSSSHDASAALPQVFSSFQCVRKHTLYLVLSLWPAPTPTLRTLFLDRKLLIALDPDSLMLELLAASCRSLAEGRRDAAFSSLERDVRSFTQTLRAIIAEKNLLLQLCRLVRVSYYRAIVSTWWKDSSNLD